MQESVDLVHGKVTIVSVMFNVGSCRAALTRSTQNFDCATTGVDVLRTPILDRRTSSVIHRSLITPSRRCRLQAARSSYPADLAVKCSGNSITSI